MRCDIIESMLRAPERSGYQSYLSLILSELAANMRELGGGTDTSLMHTKSRAYPANTRVLKGTECGLAELRISGTRAVVRWLAPLPRALV